MIAVIKIKKKLKNEFDLAVKYFGVISILNDFNWTKMEIHILAFTLITGNINIGEPRKTFLNWYGSSKRSYLSTLLFSMQKKGLIIRKDKNLILNPSLLIELEKNLILQLNMYSES